MSYLKNNKIIWLITAIVMLVATTLFRTITANETYADEKLRAENYFLENQIAFSNVSIERNTLSIDLISSGNGYCTLEDVKAIQFVYESVFDKKLSEKITDIKIEIYDANDQMIYDCYEKDILSSSEDSAFDDEEVISSRPISSEEIIAELSSRIADNNYQIQKVDVINNQNDEVNNTLVISFLYTGDGESGKSLIDICDIVKEYSLAVRYIDKCEINVEDDSGECIFYSSEDYRFGSSIAWINPRIEEVFLQQEGPSNE